MASIAAACFAAGTITGWWMRNASLETPKGETSALTADVTARGGIGDGGRSTGDADADGTAPALAPAGDRRAPGSIATNTADSVAGATQADGGSVRLRTRLLAAGADEIEADGVIALVAADEAKQREARFALMQTRRTEDPAQRAEQRRAWREARNAPDIGQAIRTQFGDAAWERYLYASGQPNRTRVTAVPIGSDAAQAGLQRGDVLLRYDDRVVHALDDVLALAADDANGATAELEVLRGGDRRVLSVPRGALGIDAEGININPREL